MHFSNQSRVGPRFLTTSFLVGSSRSAIGSTSSLRMPTFSSMHSPAACRSSPTQLRRKKIVNLNFNQRVNLLQTQCLSSFVPSTSYQKNFRFSGLIAGFWSSLSALASSSNEAGDSQNQLTDEELRQLALELNIPLPDHDTSETRARLIQECFAAAYALCQKGEWEKIQSLAGQLSILKDHWGRTLLMRAVQSQEQDIVKGLVYLQIGLKAKDYEGNTSLHFAAINGNEAILNLLLLTNSSMIDERNEQGEAPLHVAIKADQKVSVETLMRNGANVKAPLGSLDPLALCVSYSAKNCFDALLTREGVGLKLKKGGNLLHWAIWQGNHGMLTHLLKNFQTRGLCEKADKKGRTPLSLAAYLGDEQAIKILYEEGAKLDTCDLEANTPLHWCVMGNQTHALNFLLELGCQDRANQSGQTALDLATTYGSQEMQEFMRKRVEGERWNPQAHPPKNLVIKGGGPKGIAYIAVLKQLEKSDALKRLERIAGTSAGAIFASLLSVGYTSAEIHQVLDALDLNKMLDCPAGLDIDLQTLKEWALNFKQEIKDVQEQRTFRSKAAILKRTVKAGWSWYWMPSVKKKILKERSAAGGLCEGEYFRDLIEKKIAQKVEELTGEKIEHLTFGELRKLIEGGDSRFKHLHVIATKLGPKQESKVFSSEDPSCDNIIISDAVRASMSIPVAFAPHVIHKKENGQRLVHNPEEFYVDGGLLMNFALELFDKKKYKDHLVPEENGNEPWLNPHTWGLSLYTANQEQAQQDNPPDIKKVIAELINIYTSAEELLKKPETMTPRTIDVDNRGVGLFDFDITPEKKAELLESGKIAARQFLSKSKLTRLGKSNLNYNLIELMAKKRQGFFNLKEPHSSFINRTKMMKKLESLLKPGRNRHQVIYGPGGSGKTELAIAYAYQHLEDYSLIWWINQESLQTQIIDYRALAKALNIKFEKADEEVSLEELKEKVARHLERGKFDRPWLLILDNSQGPIDKLPEGGGNILIVKRVKDSCDSNPLQIGAFEEKEALTLLETITGEKQSPKMEELARELRDSPLLLNCAAHYISSTVKLPISDYLSQYQAKVADFARIDDPDGRHASLLATYQIILGDLGRQYPHVIDCLKACAYLNHNNIPIDFLDVLLKEKNMDFSRRERLFDEISNVLGAYGLARFDQRFFSLHKLSQEIIREIPIQLSFEQVLQALNHYPWVERYNSTHKETVNDFQKMLPHCLEVLNSKALTEEHFAPATRLTLTVVRYFLETARDFDQAAIYLRKAARYEPYLPNAVKGRLNFYRGMLHFEQAGLAQDGEAKQRLYQDAFDCFEQAIKDYTSDQDKNHYKLLEQNPDKCHPTYQIGIATYYKAQVMMDLGKLDEADQLFDQANIKFIEVTGGQEHFDIARVKRSKAMILWKRGLRLNAEQELKDVIEMQRRVYKNRFDHQSSVAGTYRLLGDLLSEDPQRVEDAIAAYEESIKVNKNMYGREFYITLLKKKIASLSSKQ